MQTANDDFSADLDLIRAEFQRVKGTEKTGSQIRALIDYACPQFNLRAAAGVPVGPGALVKVLTTHFRDIVHPIGKRGADPLFYIGESEGDGAARDAPSPQINFWDAFASPSHGQDIVFDRESNSFLHLPRGTAQGVHHVRIAPISEQEFRLIAEEFAKEHADSAVQEELFEILAQARFSYYDWVSCAKRYGPEFFRKWGLFRVQRIVDLFRRRLTSLDLPVPQIEHAVRSIVADQEFAYRQRIGRSVDTWNRPGGATIPQGEYSEQNDTINARAVAIAAISSMPLSELRRLKVSLGAIIDAGLLRRK